VCTIGRKQFYLVPNESRTDLTPINFQFGRIERPFAYETRYALMAISPPQRRTDALSFEQSRPKLNPALL
jgi:hypothetical protein